MLFKYFLVVLSICIIFPQNIHSQNESVCATKPNEIANVSLLLNTTWTLKILLVEFDDIKHNDDPEYTFEDFEICFFQAEYMFPQIYIHLMEFLYSAV